MHTTQERPITNNWTTFDADSPLLSAKEVNDQLAQREVSDLTFKLIPYLAAAAAELALITNTPIRVPVGETPVALLGLIARVALTQPCATGPHTARLGEQLHRTFG